MPSPVLIGRRFYLRVRVPQDLLKQARGRTIYLPVASIWRAVKIGSGVKLSLDTSDTATAKTRFSEAYAALQAAWQSMASAPAPLTYKQILALAGEIRSAFVDAFDDEPGTVKTWEHVLVRNHRASAGRAHSLKIPTPETVASDMESRFGTLIDIKLAQRGLSIPPEQRPVLLKMVAEALDEAAIVNLMKADGDYSVSGKTSKYPPFVAAASPVSKIRGPHKAGIGVRTFASVIDEEVRRRSAGKDAVPMREATVKKFRIAADDFSTFRKSGDATTVTAKEADAWKRAMLEAGKLSNNSIKQRLQNFRTVLQWAREHSLGELYPAGNPLDIVKAPAYQTVASDARTFTMQEAATVLLAARKEQAPELRWLPWMSAYSGARINELAQLTRQDFFQVDDDWFFRLTTAGGKTLKTKASERVVPLHPELIREGLVEFLGTFAAHSEQRIFHVWSTQAIQRWVRTKVGLTREELAPSHGWRHLFEDLCMNGGVTDAARSYITGRATGKSSEGYGKSQAMLPGLAKEMRKVPSIPLNSKSST